MHGFHRRANLLEDLMLCPFGEPIILDPLEEGASVDVLQYHVGYIPLGLVIMIEQLNDIGMLQLPMHGNFFFCIAVVDLRRMRYTNLIATSSPVLLFLASFTCP